MKQLCSCATVYNFCVEWLQLEAGAVEMQYPVWSAMIRSQMNGEWWLQWASVAVVSVFQFLMTCSMQSEVMMDSRT